MGRPRKAAAARKPLAPKDTNVAVSPPPPPPPPLPRLQPELKQQMIDANHREVERRIVAIRAVREAEVERFLTQLRMALSMLPQDIRTMSLRDFRDKFCPDREFIPDPEIGVLVLKPKLAGELNVSRQSTGNAFDFFRDHHKDVGTVQPTPRGFPFCSSAVKEDLISSAGMLLTDEPIDEDFQKFMESFKNSKLMQSSNVTTPATNGRLKVGLTPKTVRLPKKGEALLSVNGSPLGVFDKEIISIPEERPRRTRRKLRGSVTFS